MSSGGSSPQFSRRARLIPHALEKLAFLALTCGVPLAACKEEPDANPGDSAKHACPSGLPGSPMVEVASPTGALYCMDSREASQGDYFKFLGAFYDDPAGHMTDRPDAGHWAVPPGCEWNKDLRPPFGEDNPCTQTPQAFSENNAFPNLPVACVDWCDAYAYCAWAGKRLCGKIGGGSWAESDALDPNRSEWFNVCSQGGKTGYSYGDTYKADVLSESDWKVDGAPAVASAVDAPTACKGNGAPFDSIVNVGCNVGEWQDTCWNKGGYTACALYCQPNGDLPRQQTSRCDSYIPAGPEVAGTRVGFRCCHD